MNIMIDSINKKTKLLIIDFDGTLVDTRELNFYSYKKALNDEGYDIDKNSYLSECFGKHYTDFLAGFVSDNTIIEKIHNNKNEIYNKNLAKAILNEKLMDIIKLLSSEYYVALATTASKINVMRMLEYYKIVNIFDLIITGDDVNKKKPNPECFIKAIEHYNINKENVMIFEDSQVGIEAARKVTKNVFVVYND